MKFRRQLMILFLAFSVSVYYGCSSSGHEHDHSDHNDYSHEEHQEKPENKDETKVDTEKKERRNTPERSAEMRESYQNHKELGSAYNSKYVCPMHCEGSGSDRCP